MIKDALNADHNLSMGLETNTVKEVEIARLTLTLYSSVQTQLMIHCNMPLEPHRNSEFKTGAGLEKRTKNE